MKYDFDEVIDRRGTGSVRWDNNIRKYGEPDLIPLTTADMDYRTAEPVRQALRCRQKKHKRKGAFVKMAELPGKKAPKANPHLDDKKTGVYN